MHQRVGRGFVVSMLMSQTIAEDVRTIKLRIGLNLGNVHELPRDFL